MQHMPYILEVYNRV